MTWSQAKNLLVSGVIKKVRYDHNNLNGSPHNSFIYFDGFIHRVYDKIPSNHNLGGTTLRGEPDCMGIGGVNKFKQVE